jgi:hypothetical protein
LATEEVASWVNPQEQEDVVSLLQEKGADIREKEGEDGSVWGAISISASNAAVKATLIGRVQSER